MVLFYFRTEAYLRFLSKIVQAERRTKQIHLFFIPRRSNLSSLNSPNPPIPRPVRHQLCGHRHRRAHLQTGSLPLRTAEQRPLQLRFAEKHQHLRCKEKSLFRLATARIPKQSLSGRCRRTGPSDARVEGGIAFNSFCFQSSDFNAIFLTYTFRIFPPKYPELSLKRGSVTLRAFV